MINPDNNDMVILELDRPYELRLSHKALKRFSAMTGASMVEMSDTVNHYDKMTLLIWIMVTEDQQRRGEPWMTPEQLDDLLERVPRLRNIQDVVGRALDAAFPAPAPESEGEDDPQTAAGAGTGA